MGRSIHAVIVSFITLFILLNILITAVLVGLGVDRVYQPASYEVTPLGVAAVMIAGLIAAIVSGWVCRIIAKRKGPVMALLVLVMGFGALSAVSEMMERRATADAGPGDALAAEPEVRPDDEPIFNTLVKSKHPIWAMWANPVAGAIGVLIGGCACCSCCGRKDTAAFV